MSSYFIRAQPLPGNVYIADTSNHRIRKITVSTGIISTVVGTGSAGYSSEPGYATATTLYNPHDVKLGSDGNIYIADYFNHRVRKVTTATGLITTVAGNGDEGFSGDNGVGSSAALNYPHSIARDTEGTMITALNHITKS